MWLVRAWAGPLTTITAQQVVSTDSIFQSTKVPMDKRLLGGRELLKGERCAVRRRAAAADPYQQHNLWPTLRDDEQAIWHAELEKEFGCAGHHDRATDCS